MDAHTDDHGAMIGPDARDFDADVAIIGYGPTGVSAANFLGARGIKAVVLERAKDIYVRARAVTVNDWTLRCFQAVGLDAGLKAGMDQTHSLRWITYEGDVLRQVAFPPAHLGHAQSYAIYQPKMEQTLRDGAARFSDHIDVRYGMDVTGVTQDEVSVTVSASDTDTGGVSRHRVRYALACDGGSSRTREGLGIGMLGDTVDTRWVVIDAKVKRWWPNRHILTHWSDKQRPVVDIALAQGNHRWELPLQPHESEDDFQTHAQLWQLLATMGVTPEQVEIHQHAFYRHHIRQAQSWRQGRVFLLGDAAHLMPPWAGQGMQSGIRDADNLSWKLAEVLAGRLPDSLLDTYQQERVPDVARCTGMSIALGRIIKRELSEAEEAAGRPKPGAPAQPSMVTSPFLQAGWLSGKVEHMSAIGKMIPQPVVADSRGRFSLLDALIGNGFVLLGDGVDPATLLSPAERAQWMALGARSYTVLAPDQFGTGDSDIIDIEGGLIAWLRQHNANVVAVRPDRFVVATDRSGLGIPGVSVQAGASLALA